MIPDLPIENPIHSANKLSGRDKRTGQEGMLFLKQYFYLLQGRTLRWILTKLICFQLPLLCYSASLSWIEKLTSLKVKKKFRRSVTIYGEHGKVEFNFACSYLLLERMAWSYCQPPPHPNIHTHVEHCFSAWQKRYYCPFNNWSWDLTTSTHKSKVISTQHLWHV